MSMLRGNDLELHRVVAYIDLLLPAVETYGAMWAQARFIKLLYIFWLRARNIVQ